MCGSRSTGSPTTSTSGTSAATRGRIRSTSADSRAAQLCSADARPAGAPRRPRRQDVRHARQRPLGRPPATASASGCRADHQHADAGRPPHFARVARPAPTTRRHGAGRSLRSRPRRAARRRRPAATADRLARADLVVGRLQAAAATPGAAAAPNASTRPGRGVDPDRYGLPPRATCALGGVQHRRVLDRGVHEASPGPVPARPEHRGVQRLRAAGGEADLVRAGPQALGDRLARRVEQQRRPAPAP